MRRLFIIVPAAVLAIGLFAVPVSAAGRTFHFSVSGPGAEAGWSTLPFEGNPVPNTVYTDTFVSAALQAIDDNGTKFTDKFAFIDQFSYKFDRRGNFVFVSETFGEASGSDVALAVTKALGSASLSASVQLTTCTERACSDAGIGSLSASWTATGAAVRVNGTFTVVSKGFTEVSHQRGTFRDASAVGTLNGLGFGTQFFADIFAMSFSDKFVCHGC